MKPPVEMTSLSFDHRSHGSLPDWLHGSDQPYRQNWSLNLGKRLVRRAKQA